MHEFTRARSSTEAFWAFDPFALVTYSDPRFADIEQDLPRDHFGVTAPVRRHFQNPARKPGTVKFAVIGHQGTGKSTLVGKAMASLRPMGILPVTIDALTEFDHADLLLPDVVLVIVRAVITELDAQGVALDPEVVAAVYTWFAEELLLHSSSKQITASLGGEVQGGVDIPFLAKFVSRFVAALKTDNEYRKEIRQHALRDINVLIDRANLLLRKAHEALAQRKQELCVVFDNLEKLNDRSMVARAVLAPAQELRRLHVHIVWFLHPADDYAPGDVAASAAWPVVNVPALPVRLRGDGVEIVRADACKAIHRLLDARAVLDEVFAEPQRAVELLARMSGGHVRHILRLATRAAELAEPAKIELRHIESAVRWLAGHLTPLMTSEDWPRAVEIHETQQIRNGTEDARMLLHSCVLSYNGDPWWDVHPAVREDAGFARARQRGSLHVDG